MLQPSISHLLFTLASQKRVCFHEDKPSVWMIRHCFSRKEASSTDIFPFYKNEPAKTSIRFPLASKPASRIDQVSLSFTKRTIQKDEKNRPERDVLFCKHTAQMKGVLCMKATLQNSATILAFRTSLQRRTKRTPRTVRHITLSPQHMITSKQNEYNHHLTRNDEDKVECSCSYDISPLGAVAEHLRIKKTRKWAQPSSNQKREDQGCLRPLT
jgi:hypothetical protein